jgi:hypothetical protein
MRIGLKKELGKRKKFKGLFVRIGRKTGFNGFSQETILLKDIIDLENGALVTDHLWLNLTKGFEALSIKEGVALEFEARIKEYTKGYVNSRYKIDQQKKDYKLSHPTKFKIATPYQIEKKPDLAD